MKKTVLIGTWRMALEGMHEALKKLENGDSVIDALLCAINSVENNPDYISVGYGGLPNVEGVVELDAGIMDGDSLSFGAVAGVRCIKNPINVARAIMNDEVNNFLVGEGAYKKAIELGEVHSELLIAKSRTRYENEKSRNKLKAYDGHDTVGIVGMDKNGKIAAATSTSGLFLKATGRVGDSPMPGNGYYADSDAGAAAATGLGEDISKTALAYEAVRLMGSGLNAQEAAEKTVRDYDIKLKRKRGVVGDASIVCVDKKGNVGAYTNAVHFSYVISDECGSRVYIMSNKEGNVSVELASENWIATHTE